MLYLLFISQYRPFNQLYITDNTERFNFKSGRTVYVTKLTKTDWLDSSLIYNFIKSFITKVSEY